MKKVLITGNAGMIGTVLTHYFLKTGYAVVGIDNLSGGFRNNIPTNVTFYHYDIRYGESVTKVFYDERPDYVIHCAAYAAEILSPFIRSFNYENNVVGSMHVINACINFDVQKMVNFSSIATYGELAPPFKETDVRNPKDCYGIAKLTVEMDLKEAAEHFGLKSSSVLPHNVVSKYQNYYDRYRNVIAIWIRQCLANENITIFGDGSQKRSFSDCKFLCAPIERLLTEFDGEIFNVGSDKDVTIKEAAELVLSVARRFGSTSQIVYLEPRREVKIAIADHTKAKTLLGFEDQTNLDLMIEEMYLYAMNLPKMEVEYMPYEVNKNMYSFWKK
jgi:UDP-glucose 4-epimerase